MKEAFECLEKAAVCDRLAWHARDASSTRLFHDIAGQWRRLARDTDRHKRQTGGSPGPDVGETIRRQRP
ncbi:MAG: hypothetical protein JSS04_07170 [Proteobacteria bacterium]|nr:hypothetical protein [Pseudomonadota bacterium]